MLKKKDTSLFSLEGTAVIKGRTQLNLGTMRGGEGGREFCFDFSLFVLELILTKATAQETEETEQRDPNHSKTSLLASMF